MLGIPETIGDLGGLDLDELVWQHVQAGLADDVPPVARVRRACTRAKETLSAEDEVVVRIRRGEARGAVRLDRATFEGLIAPHVDRTVTALRRTIASAGLEPGQLTALLLVGGSARIPLVVRVVTEQLGCVPVVHGAPDLIARGAVLALTAPGATVDRGALVSTASGYLAVRPGAGAADTVKLAVPDAATSEARTSDVDAPAPTDVPGSEEYGPESGPAESSRATQPSDVPPPAPQPVVETPAAVPTPRRSPSRRAAAVLDPGTRRIGRRSLSRTLVGVGAVIVAVLVLVALFRPDGPLDPPLDPVAGDGASATAGPADAPIRTDLEADPATVAVRPAVGAPADPRPSVTTTPPLAPRALPAGVRAGAPPTAMTPPPPVV
jgi:hypothetical protein